MIASGDWMATTPPPPPKCNRCGRQPRYPYGPRVEMCEALPQRNNDAPQRSIWDLAEKAQADVDKWPEWKRRAADQALVPRRDDAVTMAALSDAAEARALRERNKALVSEVADLKDYLREAIARSLKGGS